MASNNMMQMATEDPSALVVPETPAEPPAEEDGPPAEEDGPPADVGRGQYGLGAKSPTQLAKARY